MWAVGGVLSFGVMVAYLIMRRYGHNWLGTSFADHGPGASGRDLTFHYWRQPHVFYVDLAVGGVEGIHFSLKQQRWWDSLFKHLGLVTECQTRDKAFDDQYHLLSDSPGVCQLLQANPDIIALIKQIRSQSFPTGMQLISLHVNRHKIWIRFHPFNRAARPNYPALNAVYLPLLQQLRVAVESAVAQTDPMALRDRKAMKAAALLGISTAFILALVPLFLYWSKLESVPVGDNFLFSYAVAVGTTIAMTAMALAVLILRRSSRLHLVLIEWLLVGWPGAVMVSAIALDLWNRDVHATPVIRQVAVTHVSEEARIWGGKRYHLHAESGYTTRKGLLLSVKPELMQDVIHSKDTVYIRLEERMGRLGVPWVQIAFPDPSVLRLTSDYRINTIKQPVGPAARPQLP